jgi:hypothetical protein
MGETGVLVVFGGGNGKRWRRKSHLFAGDVDGQSDVTLSLTMMMEKILWGTCAIAQSRNCSRESFVACVYVQVRGR